MLHPLCTCILGVTGIETEHIINFHQKNVKNRWKRKKNDGFFHRYNIFNTEVETHIVKEGKRENEGLKKRRKAPKYINNNNNDHKTKSEADDAKS